MEIKSNNRTNKIKSLGVKGKKPKSSTNYPDKLSPATWGVNFLLQSSIRPACQRKKKWQERGQNISRLWSGHIFTNNFCSPYQSTCSNACTIGIFQIKHNLLPRFLVSITEFQDRKHCFRSGIFTVVRRRNWKTTTTMIGYSDEPRWHLCQEIHKMLSQVW